MNDSVDSAETEELNPASAGIVFAPREELTNRHRVLQCHTGGDAMIVSIRMSEEEKRLAQSYAKLKGMSLSESVKKVYFEAIEDEFDIALADEAMKQYEKDGKTLTLDEVKKALGL